jgi:hypothetical protein
MSVKTKIKLAAFFLIIISNLSCQEKKHITENHQKTIGMSDNVIQTVLKKQLEEGAIISIDQAGAELPKTPFTLEELNASAQSVDDILKSNGFQELKEEDFNKKIKNIFGRIIDPKSDSQFLYLNFLDQCDREFVMYKNNGVDYAGLYIDKPRKIITEFYYLPEILDYQKEFPALNEIETKKIIRHSSNQNLEIEIPHWKDVPDLKEQRKKITQTIIARNMYLLNNNKTYITWLIAHDKKFIKMLVKNFGYDQEPKFNEMLINDYISANDPSKIGELIFSKNCKKELEIHEGILKSIVSIYKTNSNPKELYGLLEFCRKLLKNEEFNDYSEKEKVKMIAYIANTYDILFKQNHRIQDGWDPRWNILGECFEGSSQHTIKWAQLKDEILKNNYYNLPNLKDLISYAEGFDSVGAPD